MKKIITALTIMAMIALIGCAQKPQGADCGAVAPEYRDACCAQKMQGAIHPMCVGGWKYMPETGQCAWVCETGQEIRSFEECAAAGNPVMESYPRQCRTPDGRTFTEEIQDKDQVIGGQRDEHGCLGPAGYTWVASIGGCVRTWELDDQQKFAAKTAIDKIGQQYGLTVVEVMTARCPGCFTVKLTDANNTPIQVKLEDWKVTEIN